MRRWTNYLLLPLIVPVLILLAWEALSSQGLISPIILPAPSTIWDTLVEMVKSGELLGHLRVSLLRVLQGFSVGGGLGLLVGTGIGLSRRLERALTLITGLLRPIPIIAWVPVLILWMGIDEGSKVTVIAIGSFWPVLLNVIQGIRSTDKKYLEVARILEKSRATLLLKVIFPSALPSIFTGLRVGIGIAWMSVIGAELIAASAGVGYMIMYARELSQPDVMLVGVISIGITGLGIDFLLRRLEGRLLKWNVNVRG
ncbi:ABC transporter permease [Geobacter pickeringii]|uniref:ABC transporter permease n=1 Tax=Geobacter pickeringii TaxID=345632 RepID=A0A0B5BDH9_9BACT|nr:ABC transporter permease [Geobacter pickeringii]